MTFLGDVWRRVKKTPLLDVIVAIQAAINWINGGKKK